MVNEYKQFHDYYAKNLNVEEIDWTTFEWGQLFTLVYDDAKIQIYPYKIIKDFVHSDELKVYDQRGDGKQYFCTGFHDNGFTPKNVLGTVRGNRQRFYDLVDLIIESYKDKVTEKMNAKLEHYNYFKKSVDFSFYDYNDASIFVTNPEVMERKDEILQDALEVFDEFNLKFKDYEWDYDAGMFDELACALRFTIN